MKKYLKGFTLVELMVVMAVIAVLATMALFGLNKAQASARDVRRQQIMTGISGALERYYGDAQKYYNTDNTFCAMTTFLVTGGYLAAQPNDPKTGTVICTAATGNLSAGGATYTYTAAPVAPANATSYSLVLTKESGGTNTFVNPQ